MAMLNNQRAIKIYIYIIYVCVCVCVKRYSKTINHQFIAGFSVCFQQTQHVELLEPKLSCDLTVMIVKQGFFIPKESLIISSEWILIVNSLIYYSPRMNEEFCYYVCFFWWRLLTHTLGSLGLLQRKSTEPGSWNLLQPASRRDCWHATVHDHFPSALRTVDRAAREGRRRSKLWMVGIGSTPSQGIPSGYVKIAIENGHL